MAVNLDVDVGQLIRNFLNKGKKAGQKPGEAGTSFAMEQYKQAGIKCVIAICVTSILLWGINYLTKSSVTKDESEFTTLSQLEEAVTKMEQDIVSGKDLLAKNRKKVEEIMPMFSDVEGSKSLFKLVSGLAAQNRLIIKNLSQGEVIETITPAKFYQTKILLEMEGLYPSYMEFIKELERQKPLMNIESEELKLSTDSSGKRKLEISISFIDYSVKKEEYEEILQK